MTQIMRDATALDKLRAVAGAAEIIDSRGQVIDVFRTATAGALDRFGVPYTLEELEKFESEPGGRSLEEILRDLRASP